jgi:hypothetical protein
MRQRLPVVLVVSPFAALALTGCAATFKTFPPDRGGTDTAGVREQVARIYEQEEAASRVRKVAFRSDWQIERDPSGAIVRRTIEAYVGFESRSSPGRCGVDDVSYAQESTGPNAWGALHTYGVGPDGKGIACDAFGGDSPMPTRSTRVAVGPGNAPPAGREDPNLRFSAAELDAFAADYVRGYDSPVHASARLDGFSPVSIEVARGRCYRLVYRLAGGATLSAAAQRRLTVAVRSPGSDSSIITSKIHGPGGVASAGCPKQSGTAKIDLFAQGSEEWQAAHDLGSGEVTLDVYAKPVSEAELSAQVADDARQDEAARAATQKSCAACRREKDLCLDGKRQPATGSCVSDFDACVMRSGLKGSCD